MHDDRSAEPPAGVAPYGTPEHEHQRRIVLELAASPPVDGDAVDDLARLFEISIDEAEAAAAVLERAGLCIRRNTRLFASDQLRAVEYLWPIAL
jgi:hypothetical protein